MKNISLLVSVCFSLIVLVGATVWEGAAAVASNAELPENGFFIATNSFPLDTVLEVTNLDNGKTVRVVASAGISNPGLLALLSREAAASIDLQARTVSRVRIAQGVDSAALERPRDGLSFSGDPDYDPAALIALNGINPFLAQGSPAIDIGTAGNSRIESGDTILDLPADYAPMIRNEDIIPASRPYLSEASQPFSEASLPYSGSAAFSNDAPPSYAGTYADLSLIPSETRPPENSSEIDPAFIIPEIVAVADTDISGSAFIDPAFIIPAFDESPLPSQAVPDQSSILPPAPYLSELLIPNDPALAFETPYAMSDERDFPESSMSDLGPFSAPMIGGLETGMYYIQIAAYSKEDTVRSELSKLDSSLPVAIMNAGNDEKPVYRILIGPVNLGESGALLQRFKANYGDAFIRLGR